MTVTVTPTPPARSLVSDHIAQIERWLAEQPAREHEGQTLRADPFYVRADAELGVALVAVRGTRPDGSDLELPFESWWFRFEAGRVRQAWSL